MKKYEDEKVLDAPVLEIIQEKYDTIFSAEKKVADYVLANPDRVVDFTVLELSRSSGVSDATVVRMCHHLGYKGYYQFRLLLARDVGRSEDTEAQNDFSRFLSEYSSAILSLGEHNDEAAVREFIAAIRSGRQIHILAVGNTMPLSLYMGFRLGRLGIRCTYGIAPEYFLNEVNLAEKDDVILSISQSGNSKQVIQGVKLAREKKLKTLAITENPDSPIARLSSLKLFTGDGRTNHTYQRHYSRLQEFAVIDTVLELLTSWKDIVEKDAEKPEEILSVYKQK